MLFAEQFILADILQKLDVAFHANPLPDALKGTGRGANKHAS